MALRGAVSTRAGLASLVPGSSGSEHSGTGRTWRCQPTAHGSDVHPEQRPRLSTYISGSSGNHQEVAMTHCSLPLVGPYSPGLQ